MFLLSIFVFIIIKNTKMWYNSQHAYLHSQRYSMSTQNPGMPTRKLLHPWSLSVSPRSVEMYPVSSVVFRKWMSGKVTKSRPYFFLRCLLISFLFLSKVSLVNPDDLQNCPLVIISPIWTVFVPRALNGWAMFTMCSKVCHGLDSTLMSFPPIHRRRKTAPGLKSIHDFNTSWWGLSVYLFLYKI